MERNKAYIIFSQLKRDYYGPSEIEYIYLVRKALLILWRIWFYILAAVPVILLFLPLAFMLLLPNGYRYVFWVARNLWAPIVLFGSGFWIKKNKFFTKGGGKCDIDCKSQQFYGYHADV